MLFSDPLWRGSTVQNSQPKLLDNISAMVLDNGATIDTESEEGTIIIGLDGKKGEYKSNSKVGEKS